MGCCKEQGMCLQSTWISILACLLNAFNRQELFLLNALLVFL